MFPDIVISPQTFVIYQISQGHCSRKAVLYVHVQLSSNFSSDCLFCLFSIRTRLLLKCFISVFENFILWCSKLLSILFNQNDSRLFNYLAFIYFGFECTWWRLFQKHVVHTKFDIYVFIKTSFPTLHLGKDIISHSSGYILFTWPATGFSILLIQKKNGFELHSTENSNYFVIILLFKS